MDDESKKKKTCHVFLCERVSKFYDSSTNTMINFTTILRGMKVCSSCASVMSIGVVNMHSKNTLFYRFFYVPSLHSGLFFTSPSFFPLSKSNKNFFSSTRTIFAEHFLPFAVHIVKFLKAKNKLD